MVRTQIYLTAGEKAALNDLAVLTGKPQSELIREAVDGFIGQFSQKRRAAILKNAAGMWKDRDDLPNFAAMRTQWDRGSSS